MGKTFQELEKGNKVKLIYTGKSVDAVVEIAPLASRDKDTGLFLFRGNENKPVFGKPIHRVYVRENQADMSNDGNAIILREDEKYQKEVIWELQGRLYEMDDISLKSVGL